jgi:methionyl aminopeptidase
MITIKKPEEIEKMRRAGRVVADILRAMRDAVRPGASTLELADEADRVIERAGAKASFKGYKVSGIRSPFPSSICVSVNEEVVHGIPSAGRILAEGDIVSVDVGAIVDGYHGDAACTYPVGAISPERAKLLDVTLRALHMGMEQAKAGATLGDVGHAIEEWVLSNGCGLVRDYAGHGIGRRLHEAPQVPNYGKAHDGVTLKAGMTICIEPMVMSGGEKVRSTENGWTVVTCDGSDAAHFENAMLITSDGVEVLTPWE